MNFGAALRKLCVLAATSLLVLACRAAEPPAAQWSDSGDGGGGGKNLTLRQFRLCLENEQYAHKGLCCLNCKAGTYVHKECERDLEQGTCIPCEDGQTYTEHSNGMNRCLPCTHCRSDEIETAHCTRTADTRCKCKPGTFCVPDQACEVCKRCAKCKSGEVEVKECTPFSNTLCRKRDPSPTKPSSALPTPGPTSSSPDWVLPVSISLVLFILLILIGLAVWWFIIKRRREIPCSQSRSESSEIVKIPIGESGATAEERQNNQNAGLEGEESRPESRPLLQETQPGMTKASPPLEDEDRGLGDSLPNTTSSSQTSLSGLPTASGSTPRPSPSAFRLPPADVNDPLRYRLVPLLGSEKSLKKSFDLFDEYLDVRIHNKFFRMIGVSDNHIRMAEGGSSVGDKVYELLKNWMQRQGLKADINDLLGALLSMDQKRSAEDIASAALRRGYYRHADAP